MKTLNDNNAIPQAGKPRAARRWILTATLAVAAGAMGTAGALAYGGAPLGHHGHGARMAMDPAAMDKHVDAMVAKVLADGTPEQKAKVAAIARAALADLRPAHVQMANAHARAQELLMAPVIDRAALERLRADQMIQMDFASRRILLAVEDTADVMSPEQRARFAGHLKAFMH